MLHTQGTTLFIKNLGSGVSNSRDQGDIFGSTYMGGSIWLSGDRLWPEYSPHTLLHGSCEELAAYPRYAEIPCTTRYVVCPFLFCVSVARGDERKR